MTMNKSHAQFAIGLTSIVVYAWLGFHVGSWVAPVLELRDDVPAVALSLFGMLSIAGAILGAYLLYLLSMLIGMVLINDQ